MDWLIPVVVFLGGALVATVFQILLQGPVFALLSRIALPFASKQDRSVAGVWRSAYSYPTKGRVDVEYQVIVLRQFGRTVVGESHVDGRHRQRLVGRLRNDRHLTGTWENLKQEQLWHGAFQFELHPEGQCLTGRWLGFDSDDKVQTGPWVLELVTRKSAVLKDDIRTQLLDDCSRLSDALGIHSERVGNLIKLYSQAWISGDPSMLDAIFTTDARYQENAFKPAHIGLRQIKQYWADRIIRTQRNIEFVLLGVEFVDHTIVAEWEAEFDDIEDKKRKIIREVALIKTRDMKISSITEYWATKVKHQLVPAGGPVCEGDVPGPH